MRARFEVGDQLSVGRPGRTTLREHSSRTPARRGAAPGRSTRNGGRTWETITPVSRAHTRAQHTLRVARSRRFGIKHHTRSLTQRDTWGTESGRSGFSNTQRLRQPTHARGAV
jgi:hypothetical protein